MSPDKKRKTRSTGRGPNSKKVVRLTDEEREKLHHLYLYSGAWTEAEATENLGYERTSELLKQEALGFQDTDMGPMIQLRAIGRNSLYGFASKAAAFTTQLDQSYVRRSMEEKVWDQFTPDMPYYRGLKDLVRLPQAIECETIYGHSLVIGKLIGNGYSTMTIKNLAQRVRSTALSQNFHLVILTPSQRKGQEVAKAYNSFLHLVPWLPSTTDNMRRFNPVQGPRTKATGPFITPAVGAKLQRDYGPVLYSKVTLKRLQLERDQRIDEALLALETDKVMTARQLRLYFGLRPADLPGALMSRALVRPLRSATGTEVAETFLTLSPSITHLADPQVNHLLLTAQARYNMDIPADEHWQVSVKLNRHHTPDAIHIRQDGSMDAIEADTGYKLEAVLKKLESFKISGYEETHWVTTSEAHVKTLTHEIPHNLTPTFQVADWWELPDSI